MAGLRTIWCSVVLLGALLQPGAASAQDAVSPQDVISAQDAASRSRVLVEAAEVSGNQVCAYLGLQDEAAGVEELWMAGRWRDVVEIADRLIAKNKQHHGGHALKYLALLEIKGDRALATRAAVQATKDLASSPMALGDFINLALYVRPRVYEYQLALMALVPVVPDARKVASVRVAHLRALAGCGKFKEALATNRDIVEDLSGSAEDLLVLARGICEMAQGKPLGHMARQALDRALQSTQRNLEVSMLEYQILHDFEGNKKAAHELGKKIIEEGSKSQGLNNWLWYLMTRRATEGKYLSLVLQAARQLMQESNSSAPLDTIALALYYNGMLDEALEYQERAVAASGGNASAGIRRRLEIFREAKEKRDKQDRGEKEDKREMQEPRQRRQKQEKQGKQEKKGKQEKQGKVR